MIIRGIELHKVFYEKGREIKAVDGISIDIYEGSFISIVGVSGSGKTTLLLMLSGLLKPTSGEIYWDKEKLSKKSPLEIAKLRREKIGIVFQKTFLIPYLTVRENLEYPLIVNYGEVTKQKREYISTLIEKFGLKDVEKSYPTRLSGGEMRRVTIARALVNSPQILFADEPTSDLDHHSALQIYSIFQELNKLGLTIFVVTHNLELAKMAKEVYVINRGKIEKFISYVH